MGIGFATITGVSIGFEVFGSVEAQMIDKVANWGMCIDLIIFRIIVTF